MKFVNYKIELNGDTITIPLNRPCKCNIALAEISMAEIASPVDISHAIDVTCDQINATFDNPNRLLKIVPFNALEDGKYYHTWTARFLQMEEVDSEDKFLTLRIKRTSTGENLVLGSIFTDNRILLTLAFTETNSLMAWTTAI